MHCLLNNKSYFCINIYNENKNIMEEKKENEEPVKKYKGKGNRNIGKIAVERGCGFKPGQSGNPGGSKRGSYGDIARRFGLDIGRRVPKVYKYKLIEHLLDLPETQLKDVEKNPNVPIFMSSIAKALIQDKKKGVITTVNLIFDRVFGKAHQSLMIDDRTLNEMTESNLKEYDNESLLSFLIENAEIVIPESIPSYEDEITIIDGIEYPTKVHQPFLL